MGMLKNVLYLKTMGREYEIISRVSRILNRAEERRETKLKWPMCWVPAICNQQTVKLWFPHVWEPNTATSILALVNKEEWQRGSRDFLFPLNLDFQ